MKLKISFPEERVKSPILSEVILKTGILVSIVSSRVDSKGGEIIIEVIDKSYETIKEEFETRGAAVTFLDTLICRNKEECIECGACISVCPSKVFGYAQDWSLTMDTQKCIRCGLCVDMCPHQALSIEGTECE
ncbi:MAG: 4Fe-4S binding protein [Methanosarcinales archaeon]|jgi:ferredoxin|nr:4Fe-4S binding protein [Methanosarcinales archaeon]